MLGKFESFFYNRNVNNGFWYGKPNFLPAPHLIWYMDSQISGNGGERKFLFLYHHPEKALGPRSSKVNVVKF